MYRAGMGLAGALHEGVAFRAEKERCRDALEGSNQLKASVVSVRDEDGDAAVGEYRANQGHERGFDGVLASSDFVVCEACEGYGQDPAGEDDPGHEGLNVSDGGLVDEDGDMRGRGCAQKQADEFRDESFGREEFVAQQSIKTFDAALQCPGGGHGSSQSAQRELSVANAYACAEREKGVGKVSDVRLKRLSQRRKGSSDEIDDLLSLHAPVLLSVLKGRENWYGAGTNSVPNA